jgi:xanthine dehydrogenase accessory factor
VLVVGDTPIARALHRIGAALGYELRTFSGAVDHDAAAVVVASHGRDEEDALRAALLSDVGYVGLVASRRRGESVVASLRMCASHTSRVHVPAGFDIGARTPEEVALSILAEVVASRPRHTAGVSGEGAASLDTGTVGTAIDPVCHMAVAMVEASLHLDHGGTRVWFCGTGCLRAFAADPAA